MTNSPLIELLKDIEANCAVLIDVREHGEHQKFHVKDSILWPLSELEKASKESLLEKLKPYQSKHIYVHCRSGTRALYAIDILKPHHTNLVRIAQSPEQIQAFLEQV